MGNGTNTQPMSNYPDHERTRDASSETDSEGPVYCCRICQLEADGGRRATDPSFTTELPHSFDVVIASLVFCTIPDFDAALSEVARVLKPGGEFRFLEQVRGEDAVGIAYDVLAPAWHTVAGGCHLNRETDEIFRDDDRFELVDYTRLEDTPRIVPIVRGTLERRRKGSILSRFV